MVYPPQQLGGRREWGNLFRGQASTHACFASVLTAAPPFENVPLKRASAAYRWVVTTGNPVFPVALLDARWYKLVYCDNYICADLSGQCLLGLYSLFQSMWKTL